MGFDTNKSAKALKATKSASLEAAMDWILSNPDPEPNIQSVPPQENKPPSNVPTNTPTNEPTPMDTENTSNTTTTSEQVNTQIPDSDKPPILHNAICNKCEEQIVGIRNHCKNCRDYDLCNDCYLEKKNIIQNILLKFLQKML